MGIRLEKVQPDCLSSAVVLCVKMLQYFMEIIHRIIWPVSLVTVCIFLVLFRFVLFCVGLLCQGYASVEVCCQSCFCIMID